MTIWDNLLKRALQPVIDKSIADYKKQQIEKGMSAMALSAQPYYPMGTGKASDSQKLYARTYNFETLRNFALYYPILRSCINYRKRQVTQLAWDITPRELSVDPKETDRHKEDVKVVKEFLNHPTGDPTTSFRSFVSKLIEDLLTLDAISIYKRKNMKGGLYGYLPLDASTIELLLKEDGTTPVAPEKAYIQKIRGRIVEEFSTDELIYRMMNPRTNSPYGLSPVETLIITVTTALKLSNYNLNYLTEGNIPEGFVELPKDVASNGDQLKQWQEAWDSMFAGNAKYQRKVKFLPEGMKWTPIKKVEDMEFERFEKWLLLQTCSVMEVAPQAIGFQFERGKGATETEWEIGKERGMYPLANFIKEIIDEIIQTDLGQDHLEFVWTNIDPTNKKEEADVFKALVTTGAVSVDEWRLGEGLNPIGLPHYVMTPVGPILVKDFVEASERGTPLIPYNYQQTPKNQTLSGGGKAPTAPSTNTVSAKPGVRNSGFDAASTAGTNPVPKASANKIDEVSREEIMEELKRWKKVVMKDMKVGKGYRDFKSDIIDVRTQKLIKEGLQSVKTKEDLDTLFNPLINQENDIIESVVKLYNEIATITNGESSPE